MLVSGVAEHPRWVLLVLLLAAAQARARTDLTFLAWSDQHVTAGGDASHLGATVDAMNALAGADPRPEFVLGCGDCTDWPTRSAVREYAAAAGRLNYARYDMLGNHDEGDASWRSLADRHPAAMATAVAVGVVAMALAIHLRRRRYMLLVGILISVAMGALVARWLLNTQDRMRRWIIARHGATSYVFAQSGVRFIIVHAPCNSAQRLTSEALAFIRAQVGQTPQGQPIVVAMHYSLNAISNKDDLVDAYGAANVVLTLGGHYHQFASGEYRGRRFAQVPSPRTSSDHGPRFLVVRIRDNDVSVSLGGAPSGADKCVLPGEPGPADAAPAGPSAGAPTVHRPGPSSQPTLIPK